jgi:DNA-binding Lrp family transcriptional regulator
MVDLGLPDKAKRIDRQERSESVGLWVPDRFDNLKTFYGRWVMALSVRAVERALDILLCFSTEEPIQSLSQIAESVHLSKPTVHRLLASLEKKQFIAKDQATSQYRLGIHGQGAGSGSDFLAQSSARALDESGKIRGLKINAPRTVNSVPAFVSAAIPNNPQASKADSSVLGTRIFAGNPR